MMATNDRGFPVELSGAKISTLLWAREDDIGAQALQQLRNIGELPWTHGLRADVQNRLHKAQHQMGTLGGNHFQELCLDEDGNVWVMLHSGSQNIGNELAQRHRAIARLNQVVCV